MKNAAAQWHDLPSTPERHLRCVPDSGSAGTAHSPLDEASAEGLARAMAAAAEVGEGYRRRELIRQRRSLVGAPPGARRVTLYVAREQAIRLARLVKESGRDRNDVLADALALYLDELDV